MDLKEIQNLIKFVSKSGVSEVSMEQGEFKITIKTDLPAGQIMMQQPVNVGVPAALPAALPAAAPIAAPGQKTGYLIMSLSEYRRSPGKAL